MLLAVAGPAAADPAAVRSRFVPRTDGPPAALVLPVQAQTLPAPAPAIEPLPAPAPAIEPLPAPAPGIEPLPAPAPVAAVTPAPVQPPPGTFVASSTAKPSMDLPPPPLMPAVKPAPVLPPANVIVQVPPAEKPPAEKGPGTTLPLPAVPGTGPVPGTGGVTAGRSATDPYEAYIRLEPPGQERLFGTRDTEGQLEERMRQERRDTVGGDPVVFPDKPKVSETDFEARKNAPMTVLAEASYIVYRPLYFEEKNSERYGWDLGPIQPLVSTLAFFKDVALWPAHFAAYPCRRFDTNAGQCLPGDPVPYIWYPPELTGSALVAEVAFLALLFAAVP